MTKPASCLRISLLGAALLLSGCASAPMSPTLPPGLIALVPAQFPPEADFNVYARGKGAAAGELGARGAATGMASGAIAPLAMGPVGVVGYPIIAPFTILVGLVAGGALGAGYGALHGLPAEQAEMAGMLANQAVNQIDVQTTLARRVLETSPQPGSKIELQAQAGPRSNQDAFDYMAWKSTYRAVLELTVEKIGMPVRKGDPPRLALEMKLRARVICLSPEACIGGDKHLEWTGKPHALQEWQAGGGDMLAAEFESGYASLAAYIQETLLSPIKH